MSLLPINHFSIRCANKVTTPKGIFYNQLIVLNVCDEHIQHKNKSAKIFNVIL